MVGRVLTTDTTVHCTAVLRVGAVFCSVQHVVVLRILAYV